MRLCQSRRRLLLPLLAATASASSHRIGAEFSLRPVAAGLCDIVKQSLGGFNAQNGSAAAVDASGWPLEDAYIIIFDEAPVAGDPSAFVPASIDGAYAVSWSGNASVIVGPGTEAALSAVSFDAGSWTGSATVTLTPSGGARIPGLVLGFSDTVRVRGGARNSGIANLTVLAPGCSDGAPLWHPALLRAVAPFTQLRMMEWFGTNAVRNYSRPDHGVLEWSTRTQLSDAVWGGARDGAVGAPWETAVLLAQALETTDVWVNVPIYASADFVTQLAALLHRGAAGTGGAGLPRGIKLYVELGNEVWLNGTLGGPGSNYLWNVAAAQAEVAANASSPLASGGVTDPQVWARRRHMRELLAVAAAFAAEWEPGALRTTVLPVLGSTADYAPDVAASLAWARAELGADPAALLAAVAVNCYLIAGFPAGTPAAAMPAAWLAASDAAAPARARMAAAAGALGLALVSYEGSPVGVALGEGAGGGPTTDAIIHVQRSPAMAPVFARDVANFEAAGGAAYNVYALASAYGPPWRYQWGLLEDLRNLSASKYEAVLSLLQPEGR